MVNRTVAIHRNVATCVWMAVVSALVATMPVWAASDPATICDDAARRASEQTGVPLNILLAITRVETGRGDKNDLKPWPWTINRDNAGTWYDTLDAAIGAANTALTSGADNFDLGCFQLNYHWHGEAFPGVSDMLDPDNNAGYAARFLAQLFQEKGNWADAVAAYHSATGDLAQGYLTRVRDVVASIAPGQNGSDLGQVSLAQRENTFPLLRVGQRGRNGSIVPAGGLDRPLITESP